MMDMESWNRSKWVTERNRFIAARKDHVSWSGLFMIFFVTGGITLLTSVVLRHATSITMPWRYVLALAAGYGAFFFAIRVWADFQRHSPQYRPKGDDHGILDAIQASGAGELGFAYILLLPFALILGGIMSWFGAAMLLEVAFEVAFAGMMVRGAWAAETRVGNWAGVLLRKTGGVALVLMMLVFTAAHYVQSRNPQVQTAADTFKLLFH